MQVTSMGIASPLILLLVAPLLLAQDTSVQEEPDRQQRLPYEVVVTPNVTRGQLEKLLVQIEDDFFEKFNELNIDNDYDVNCYEFVPTGTHIRRRVCEPEFFMDRRSENASEHVLALMQKHVFPPPLLGRRDLRAVTVQEFEILQGKMEEMNRTDLELRSIGEALAKVKSRIESFSKEK